MKIFKIDIQKLGILLLPTLLRKHKMVAWIRALVTPLDTLHYNFVNKRNADIYNLNHNGQKCYLRKALNDAFDSQLRRVRIDDAPRYASEYIYTRAEGKTKFLGKMTIRTRGENQVTGLNFIVQVPMELQYLELQIKVLVDYYKLASKHYKIIYV